MVPDGHITLLSRATLFVLVLSLTVFFQGTSWAGDNDKIRVITDWQEDEGPIRVDCWNLEIVGNGIGGHLLSCEDRLSLYALFNCFPMKKCAVEARCPGWQGLAADIDWERVAELIDEQRAEKAADEEKWKRALDQ